jgi:hypothetical protein
MIRNRSKLIVQRNDGAIPPLAGQLAAWDTARLADQKGVLMRDYVPVWRNSETKTIIYLRDE